MSVDGLIYSTDGRIRGSTTRNTQELNERLDEWEMRQTGRRQGVCGVDRKQEMCDVVGKGQNVKEWP